MARGKKARRKTIIDVVGYIYTAHPDNLSGKGMGCTRKQADGIGTLRNYVCVRMDMTILELQSEKTRFLGISDIYHVRLDAKFEQC